MTDPRNTRRSRKPANKAGQSASQPRADQPVAEQSARPRKGKTSRGATPRATPRGGRRNPKLKAITVTVDADTAQVVRVEGLDATGTPHELSDDEKASLLTQENDGRLEELVEQAFEAGIACVLEGDTEPDTTTESATEAELRHILLTPLIEHSAARRLFERAVVDRAALGTLLEHSMK
jgi:hypothetical protein